MRLAAEANNLQTGGVEVQGQFKIKATGKAFRILIDGLYSDKIQSIVRELSSNGWDSHRALGTTKPFYVHCPTTLKPEFYIRDFGVGMTDDRVMDLYCTLFDSDKDGDNDLVGMFGLGSKSPFAYTDHFCVTCYDGVTARHYAAGIGEGGVPQIARIGTEKCDEPLGVRVSFAVQRKDFSEFEKAIQRVSMGFNPVFDTNIKINHGRGSLMLAGKGWTCHDGADSTLPSVFNVLQGCVIYPLVSTGGVTLPTDHNRKYLLDCPIGTVEVTSSRESISYSPAVVAYLKDRVKALENEISDLIRTKANKIENVHDFFETLKALKPPFVKTQFIHPETGATDAHLRVEPPACFMTVSYGDNAKRWDYDVRRAVDAQPKKPRKSDAAETVIEIKNITPLLDLAREKKAEFTQREHRRIARFLRGYLEAQQLTEGTFWLGVPWSDRVVSLIQPNLTREQKTVEELMSAVPKRRGRPAEVIIRGIALLRGDSTEQRAVGVLEGTPGACAWTTAENYRREGKAFRLLVKHYGITEFFIAASTATKKMEKSGIPPLKDAIAEKLKIKYGIDWKEFASLCITMAECDYKVGQTVSFMKDCNAKAPSALARACASRGMAGQLMAALLPYVEKKLIPLWDEEKNGWEYRNAHNLLIEEDKAAHEANRSKFKHLRAITQINGWLSGNSGHPALSFLDGLRHLKTKQQYEAVVTALITLFKVLPVNAKTKWKED